MKKLIFTLFFAVTVFLNTNAQETLDTQRVSEIQNQTSQDSFNKWSIELEAGVHKPAKPFTPGYFSNTPSLWQGGLGVRYMFNEKFGAKIGFNYQRIESDKSSLPFETEFMHVNLQGVVNAGSLLNFRSWTNTFNVLLHGGLGYGRNKPQEPIEFRNADQMLTLMAGITPQIRLGNRVALTGDLSILGNVRHSQTWDGAQSLDATLNNNEKRGLNGYIVNASIGLTFYLGNKNIHADWYSEESQLMSELQALDGRLSKVETDLIDSDQDGVPDYLDREPNTPSGVTVDTKGRAVDRNNNGIPDEMEPGLDARYALKGEVGQGVGASMTIKELIDKGYVNVYFRFNSDQPEIYSLQAVNYLTVYMKENPNASAELIGYADEIGNASYNQQLSERRANKVKELLVAAGINESRLTTRGGGQDTS
ncbi:MAG: OmpA family protein, partial [Flavobacteriales bacterium]|nr:OmpA family protein [Flavobacteriales bacterium]